MRWIPGSSDRNVEDRRGSSGGGGLGFGGGGLGGRSIGVGGFLVLLVLSVVFRQDLFSMLGSDTGDPAAPVQTTPAGPIKTTADEEKLKDFITFVLNDVQGVWAKVLPTVGSQYRDAKLVLFRDGIESACGFAQAATGPFYCPGDEKVYIDLGFYQELKERFGAPGDFAQAYVLAHEIGHHVQKILGTEPQVRRLQQQQAGRANDLSVRMELQADCYAGIWGHSAQQAGQLEAGDVQEGLGAAAAVGDDRIQRMATGRVHPESFTHGTSAQRTEWFKRGFTSGKLQDCDTFR
ncbi:MAG: neutral zinc metallopeptidase [Gemmatimonadota bacterium]